MEVKTRFTWTEDLSQELVDYINKGLKNGKHIKTLSKEFVENKKILKELPIEKAAEKVRTHYYNKIRPDKQNTSKLSKKDFAIDWTDAQDELILDYIETNKNEKSKIELYKDLSSMIDKTDSQIASRYITLCKKKNAETQKKSMDVLLDSFGKVDDELFSRVELIAKTMRELNNCDDKDKIILRKDETIKTLERSNDILLDEIENLKEQIIGFKEQLEEKNRQVKLYEEKFETFQKVLKLN